jgi:hypothetical protein
VAAFWLDHSHHHHHHHHHQSEANVVEPKIHKVICHVYTFAAAVVVIFVALPLEYLAVASKEAIFDVIS